MSLPNQDSGSRLDDKIRFKSLPPRTHSAPSPSPVIWTSPGRSSPSSLSSSSASSWSAPTVSSRRFDNRGDYEYDFPERFSTRKRTRPLLYDPSPKPSTRKTHQRSTVGTGRKHQLDSLLCPNMTNDPNVSGQAPSSHPLEYHSIPLTGTNNSEEPRMKLVDNEATITTPSSIEVPTVANSIPKSIAEIEGTNAADATTEQVGCYVVSSIFAPVLRAIINKHGDIAKECPLISGFMRNTVLEGICKIVNELQCKQLTDLENCHFYTYFSIVKDSQTMKSNVEWLSQRLDELRDASKSMAEANKLMIESRDRTAPIESLKKALQIKKQEMERRKSEVEECECQLVLETLHTDKLNTAIGSLTTKYELFVSKSLTDGLL